MSSLAIGATFIIVSIVKVFVSDSFDSFPASSITFTVNLISSASRITFVGVIVIVVFGSVTIDVPIIVPSWYK